MDHVFLRTLDNAHELIQTEPNTTKWHPRGYAVPIGPIQFDGFEYTLPEKTVCCVPRAFGEFVLQELPPDQGEVITLSNGKKQKTGGVPPVIEAEEDEWDGATYATVTRYKLQAALLPKRDYLIELAAKYGVAPARVTEYRTRQEISSEDIVREVNSLPVPEALRIPYRQKDKAAKA